MYPVAKQLGISLVQFGIIATVNLAISQVTPPVGVNLFVASSLRLPGRPCVTVAQMARDVCWKMVAACIVVLLPDATYIPAHSPCLSWANDPVLFRVSGKI